MATRYVQDATKELSGVYSPQQNIINAQLPETQALYESLYQGLDSAEAAQTQNIINSANIRGVGRQQLGADTSDALGATVGLAKAQLGRQQAGDIATTQGKLAELNVQRANDIQTLSNALQDRAISEGKYKQNVTKVNRNYNLEVLKMNRQFELDKEEARLKAAAEAAEAARQAAYYGGGGQQQQYTQGGPSAEQRNGGGFNFKDANGNSISAATYARQTGQNPMDVIRQMGQAGDSYAKQVYNQIAADPFRAKNAKRYAKYYSSLFWK